MMRDDFLPDSRVVFAFVSALVIGIASAEEPTRQPVAEKKGPPFAISKETTFITEPLDAEGYPDYIKHLDRQMRAGVTPENNALVALLRITGIRDHEYVDGKFVEKDVSPEVFRKLGMEPIPRDAKRLMHEYEFLKTLNPKPDEEVFERESSIAHGGPWRDQDAPLLAKWIDSQEPLLAGLPAAINRPRFYAPLFWSNGRRAIWSNESFSFFNGHRQIASTLAVRAYRHIGRGDLDKALADSLLLHRLARQVARRPSIVDYMVADVLEAIAVSVDTKIAHHGKLTAAQAKNIAAELAKVPPLRSPTESLQYEQIQYLDSMALIARFGPLSKHSLFEIAGDGESDPFGQVLFQNAVDWNAALALGNESYDKLSAAARIADWNQRREAVQKVERDRKNAAQREKQDVVDWLAAVLDAKVRSRMLGRQISFQLLELASPVLLDIFSIEERTQTQRDLVQIAFAMAAYRADHGKYPAELSALAPKYLAKVPVDYYSGQSYVLKTTEKGYRLYGVGPNGKDDGGELGLEDYVLEVE